MPEGHTIHRLAQDHNAWLRGQELAAMSPQGRFSAEARRLNGSCFLRAEAYGKHLFHFWSGNRITHIHLGLYGRFRVHKNPAPEPRGAVRLRLIGEHRTLDLNGPNRCHLTTPEQFEQQIKKLGQDPLRSDADPEKVWQRLKSSRAAIGSLLLNQSVIAGIGNVYRAEILYLLRICPERPARDLTRDEFDQLWQLAVDLLKTGVKYNRIITVDAQTLGKPLSRATAVERTLIYKSPECPGCGDDVYYWELGNRTIYACSRCQPA